MSFASLLDQECTIYRVTESVSTLGEKTNTYAVAASAQSVAVRRPRMRRADEGAGEAPRGSVTGFMLVGTNVQEEDVLLVTAGSESGRRLRVIAKDTPRNHHIELILEPFTGEL